jgi:hypothetical protein
MHYLLAAFPTLTESIFMNFPVIFIQFHLHQKTRPRVGNDSGITFGQRVRADILIMNERKSRLRRIHQVVEQRKAGKGEKLIRALLLLLDDLCNCVKVPNRFRIENVSF